MERLSSIEGLRDGCSRTTRGGIGTPQRLRVRICMTGCRAFGAVEVRDAFRASVAEHGAGGDKVDIVETGCHGFCARAPGGGRRPLRVLLSADLPERTSRLIVKDESPDRGEAPSRRGPLTDGPEGRPTRSPSRRTCPFYRDQMKIVLRNCGHIDPTNMDDYIVRDGYSAIAKVLSSMTPDQVIEEVIHSGLGAGAVRVSRPAEMAVCPQSRRATPST